MILLSFLFSNWLLLLRTLKQGSLLILKLGVKYNISFEIKIGFFTQFVVSTHFRTLQKVNLKRAPE